jgi:hypothetical protein
VRRNFVGVRARPNGVCASAARARSGTPSAGGAGRRRAGSAEVSERGATEPMRRMTRSDLRRASSNRPVGRRRAHGGAANSDRKQLERRALRRARSTGPLKHEVGDGRLNSGLRVPPPRSVPHSARSEESGPPLPWTPVRGRRRRARRAGRDRHASRARLGAGAGPVSRATPCRSAPPARTAAAHRGAFLASLGARPGSALPSPAPGSCRTSARRPGVARRHPRPSRRRERRISRGVCRRPDRSSCVRGRSRREHQGTPGGLTPVGSFLARAARRGAPRVGTRSGRQDPMLGGPHVLSSRSSPAGHLRGPSSGIETAVLRTALPPCGCSIRAGYAGRAPVNSQRCACDGRPHAAPRTLGDATRRTKSGSGGGHDDLRADASPVG